MELDPEGREPLYIQLANELERQVRAGELVRGRTIPSEARLQQTYGVSRGTVRKAVQVLRERQVVDTVPQRGTFVL